MEELKEKLALLGPRPPLDNAPACERSSDTKTHASSTTTSAQKAAVGRHYAQTKFVTPIDCKYYGSAVSQFVTGEQGQANRGR